MAKANGLKGIIASNGGASVITRPLHSDSDMNECIICHEDFDLEAHIPKMLDFCHHSLCITCIKQGIKDENLIYCPYKCKKPTKLDGRKVEELATNFYILPAVEKRVEQRKKVDVLFSKTQNNCAEAIALRRESFAPRLKEVQKAFQFLTGVIASTTEDNNEQTAVLQSQLEHSIEERREPLSLDVIEEEHKKSEEELKAAQMLAESFTDLEQYTCNISLTNTKDGTKYLMKSLEDCLVFINSSSHGPKISASVLALNYILTQFKSENLWDKIEEANGAVLTVEENRKSADTTNSSEEGAVALLEDNNSNNNNNINSPSRSRSLESRRSLPPSPSNNQQLPEYVYLQFSINGKLNPVAIVIQLNHKRAPIMCKTYLKYIFAEEFDLTYQSTPLIKAVKDDYILLGEFSKLKNINSSNKVEEEEARFVPDRSQLHERAGAVRFRQRQREHEHRGVLCSSEFSILLKKPRVVFPTTTVFGFVVQGLEVCEEISKFNPVRYNNIRIQACGRWHGEISHNNSNRSSL